MKRRFENNTNTTATDASTGQKHCTTEGMTSIKSLNALHRKSVQMNITKSLVSLSLMLEEKTKKLAAAKGLPKDFVRFNMLLALAQRHDVAPAFLATTGLRKESVCSLPENIVGGALLSLVKLVSGGHQQQQAQAQLQVSDEDVKKTAECLYGELKDLTLFDCNDSGESESVNKTKEQKEKEDPKGQRGRDSITEEERRFLEHYAHRNYMRNKISREESRGYSEYRTFSTISRGGHQPDGRDDDGLYSPNDNVYAMDRKERKIIDDYLKEHIKFRFFGHDFVSNFGSDAGIGDNSSESSRSESEKSSEEGEDGNDVRIDVEEEEEEEDHGLGSDSNSDGLDDGNDLDFF